MDFHHPNKSKCLYAEHLSTSSNAEGSYGFADIVAQSGTVIAKQLREAAEAAELRRQQGRS